MRTRIERDLTPEDRARIVQAYHNWRGDGDVEYGDVLGLRKAATIDVAGAKWLGAHTWTLCRCRIQGRG
jgi:type I restriction-modification system DNA methylase subunit